MKLGLLQVRCLDLPPFAVNIFRQRPVPFCAFTYIVSADDPDLTIKSDDLRYYMGEIRME